MTHYAYTPDFDELTDALAAVQRMYRRSAPEPAQPPPAQPPPAQPPPAPRVPRVADAVVNEIVAALRVTPGLTSPQVRVAVSRGTQVIWPALCAMCAAGVLRMENGAYGSRRYYVTEKEDTTHAN